MAALADASGSHPGVVGLIPLVVKSYIIAQAKLFDDVEFGSKRFSNVVKFICECFTRKCLPFNKFFFLNMLSVS